MMKNLFKKDYDLKYDFLPSDLEIIEKPASPIGKSIIYIIALFIFSMIGLACVTSINKVVVSSGKVTLIEGVKVVDSNLNGKISKINKAEGDTVLAGEALLELENFNSEIEKGKLVSELNLYKLQYDLVNYKIEGGYDEGVYSKYSIEESKIQEIKLQESMDLNSINKETETYNKTLSEIDEEKIEKQQQINELTEEYNKMDDVEKFLSGDSKLKEIESIKKSIIALDEKKESTIESRTTRLNQTKLSNIQKRNSIASQIKNLESNIEELDNNNLNYTIKSPVDGIILQMNYNTVDSYVNQSKAIAEIVPSNAEYEIESYIKNVDISKIEEGQEVVIKVDSYDYEKYGTIKGTVSYISPNSFNDENLGLTYKIKVTFDKEENKSIKIIPGLQTTIEIKSDEIKLIEYFIEPLRKNIDNALKE